MRPVRHSSGVAGRHAAAVSITTNDMNQAADGMFVLDSLAPVKTHHSADLSGGVHSAKES